MTEQLTLNRYHTEIQAIMCTCGEIRYALPETTAMLETIARQYIIDLAKEMERCAKKRGSKQLAPDDLFFVIRHHRSVFNKSIRIANWKHMYKVARDISENTADDVMEDETFLERLPQFLDVRDALPWNQLETMEMTAGIQQTIPTAQPSPQSRERLEQAARMTEHMQEDEYLEYAECRRTSFTYKKFSKFREFCDFNQHITMKPANDMLEIFGIYAVEVIKSLTLEALQLKGEMLPYGGNPKEVIEQEEDAMQSLKSTYLFAIEKEEDPLRSYHIREAYRRLKKQESRFDHPRKANVLGARFPPTTLLSSSLILDEV